LPDECLQVQHADYSRNSSIVDIFASKRSSRLKQSR
jgi:hypothetical protein